MAITIGIDIGGSQTKIIGVDAEGIKSPMLVKADDPITSLFGAFGKYLYDNKIQLSDVKKVMVTGVGSQYLDQDLYGLPTYHADEFLADGLGAHYGSRLKKLMVVSMGTGTSFVTVNGDEIKHIGGVGIGGGTILGLSKMLLHTSIVSWNWRGKVKSRIPTCRLRISAKLLCLACLFMPQPPAWEKHL